jgi:hypothetical protein
MAMDPQQANCSLILARYKLLMAWAWAMVLKISTLPL